MAVTRLLATKAGPGGFCGGIEPHPPDLFVFNDAFVPVRPLSFCNLIGAKTVILLSVEIVKFTGEGF